MEEKEIIQKPLNAMQDDKVRELLNNNGTFSK